jgi:hypothetical protein
MKVIKLTESDLNHIIRRVIQTEQDTEEEEDKKYRSMYGNRWIREPSNRLNFQYYNFINQYRSKLEVAKKCDASIKQQIMDSMK